MSRRWIAVIAAGVATSLVSYSVFATPEDGTYTGTASGQYSTAACIGPGIDTGGIVPFSGATVTLTVQNNANNVTLSFSHPDFSATGVGFSTGLNLDLTFGPPGTGNVNISNQNSGDSTSPFSAFPTVSQSGDTVSIGAEMISGSTVNCSTVNLDWNAFTVTRGGKIITDESPGTDATTEDITRIAPRVDAEVIHHRGNTRVRNHGQGSGSGFTKTSSGITYNLDSGLNAGDWPMVFGAWVNYSYNNFEDEFTATAFDGDRHGFLAGIDFQPTDNSVLGVAFGYEFNDIDTQFNQGEQETDGFTVAPYFAVLLNETLSIDMSLGYTNLDTDQFRTAPGTTTRISSEVDGDRWFGAFNLNGLWFYNKWILGARVGALYARTTQDDFTESDGTTVSETTAQLGQFNIGGDVAYSLDEWEPFVRLTYEYDITQTETPVAGPVQPDFDDDDFLLGLGVRYFNTNGWSGNLEYNKRLGREDFDEDSINLTVQGEF